MRTNDIILKTTSAIIVFVILASGGFLLLYISFGLKTMSRILRVNFRYFIATGLIIAFLTGAGSFLFGEPFMSHTYGYFNLPLLGETELATAMLFDLGVYITVIGVTMTIMLSIAEDRG
jgi:multicomponent Na+:H+ antiporter subunit B